MFSLRNLSLVVFLFSSLTLFAQNPKTKNTDKLLDHLVGLFNNKAQSDTATSPLYQPQETRIFPIMANRANEYWLYWGWFSASLPDRALEERILHIEKQDGDHWSLKIYFLPENTATAALGKRPRP